MAKGLVDIEEDDGGPARPTRLRAGAPLERRGQSSIREPAPLQRSIEPEEGETSEIGLPGDTNVHVDTETGAAVIEHPDGGAVIDFNGRDTAKDEQPGVPPEEGFGANLAERCQGILATLANRCLEGVQADLQARRDWEEMGNKGAEILGVKWEEATTDVSADGSVSKTHHPMLMEAILRSWANGVAELLPSAGPVKVRDDLPDEPPQAPLAQGQQPPGAMPASLPKRRRTEKADALEKDMNHYLTTVDVEYYDDYGAMLLMRALKGSQFRKVYVDPIVRRPLSRWVQGTDLIISNNCRHLSGALRYSERSRISQAMVKRMQVEGGWRKVQLGTPTSVVPATEEAQAQVMGITTTKTIPADHLHTVYEVHLECDEGPLAEDENGKVVGFPLPYRVTVEEDSRQILAIHRNWKEGDTRYLPRQRYVPYGMVPGLSGPYHWGFVHLLGNLQRGGTAMLREFIDSEMFASFPSGVMQKGPGMHSGKTQIRVGPGQFEVIDTGGAALDEFVKAWPFKGASAKLNDVLQTVVGEGRRLAGTLELPVGEGRAANIPVGTMLAFVDSISKVPSAIHKGDHKSQLQEFKLLKELFLEHPETLESADDRTWTEDELADQELVPAADPNTPSYVHRIMQGTAMVEMAGLPQFGGIANQREIWDRGLAILGVQNRQACTLPEQPQGAQPPDPKAMAAMAKAQNDQQKNQIAAAKLANEQQDTQREAASQAVEAEQREQDRASEEKIENMRLEAEELRAHRELAHDQATAGQEHQRGIFGEVLEHARHGAELQQEDRHHQDDVAAQHRGIDAQQDQAAMQLQQKSQEAKDKPKKDGGA